MSEQAAVVLHWQLVVQAAAAGVGLIAPNQNEGRIVGGRLAIDQALRARGRAVTDVTDSEEVDHLIGKCHELRHRSERLATEVHVEACDHYRVRRAAKRPENKVREIAGEELPLLEGNQATSGVVQNARIDLSGVLDDGSGMCMARPTGTGRTLVAIVDSVLEEMDLVTLAAKLFEETKETLGLA